MGLAHGKTPEFGARSPDDTPNTPPLADLSSPNTSSSTHNTFRNTHVAADAEVTVLLSPILSHLEQLSTFTAANFEGPNQRCPGSSQKAMIKSEVRHIGSHIVHVVRERPDGPAMEMRLCRYIAQHYWPLYGQNNAYMRFFELYRNVMAKMLATSVGTAKGHPAEDAVRRGENGQDTPTSGEEVGIDPFPRNPRGVLSLASGRRAHVDDTTDTHTLPCDPMSTSDAADDHDEDIFNAVLRALGPGANRPLPNIAQRQDVRTIDPALLAQGSNPNTPSSRASLTRRSSSLGSREDSPPKRRRLSPPESEDGGIQLPGNTHTSVDPSPPPTHPQTPDQAAPTRKSSSLDGREDSIPKRRRLSPPESEDGGIQLPGRIYTPVNAPPSPKHAQTPEELICSPSIADVPIPEELQDLAQIDSFRHLHPIGTQWVDSSDEFTMFDHVTRSDDTCYATQRQKVPTLELRPEGHEHLDEDAELQEAVRRSLEEDDADDEHV